MHAILRQYAVPVLSLGLGLAGWWWLATRRKAVTAFSSFKEAANAKHAELANTPNRPTFKVLRALLRQYGVKALESELEADGLVKDGKLTTGTKPFNLFARIGAGGVSQPETMLTRTSRGLRTARTGYAHQPPACCIRTRGAEQLVRHCT